MPILDLLHTMPNVLNRNSRLNLLFLSRAQMKKVDLDALLSTENSLSKRTLGQLIKQIKSKVDLDQSFEETLSTALEKRNFLMHRFFYSHAVNFLEEIGRNQMIDELIEISEFINNADQMMQTITLLLARTCGFSEDMINAEYERRGIFEITDKS